ncbi:hypothetical protein BN1708_020405, partial [Verticillium longisporum]
RQPRRRGDGRVPPQGLCALALGRQGPRRPRQAHVQVQGLRLCCL